MCQSVLELLHYFEVFLGVLNYRRGPYYIHGNVQGQNVRVRPKRLPSGCQNILIDASLNQLTPRQNGEWFHINSQNIIPKMRESLMRTTEHRTTRHPVDAPLMVAVKWDLQFLQCLGQLPIHPTLLLKYGWLFLPILGYLNLVKKLKPQIRINSSN